MATHVVVRIGEELLACLWNSARFVRERINSSMASATCCTSPRRAEYGRSSKSIRAATLFPRLSIQLPRSHMSRHGIISGIFFTVLLPVWGFGAVSVGRLRLIFAACSKMAAPESMQCVLPVPQRAWRLSTSGLFVQVSTGPSFRFLKLSSLCFCRPRRPAAYSPDGYSWPPLLDIAK